MAVKVRRDLTSMMLKAKGKAVKRKPDALKEADFKAAYKSIAQIFKKQGKATNAYLDAKGIHEYLYKDAQKQREEHFGKPSEKAMKDMTPPEDWLKKNTRDWRKKVAHDDMAKYLAKQAIKSGIVGGKSALKSMGAPKIDFNLQDPKLIKALTGRGTKIGGIVDANTLDSFQKTLVNRYYYAGEDPREVRRAIEGVFEETYDNRAMAIARTETGVAQMLVAKETWDQAGAKSKQWIATIGDWEHVRPSHQQCAEEGWIPYDQQFSNGLDYPLQEDGPPEEIINCRCDMIVKTDFMEEMMSQFPEGTFELSYKKRWWHGEDLSKTKHVRKVYGKN